MTSRLTCRTSARPGIGGQYRRERTRARDEVAKSRVRNPGTPSLARHRPISLSSVGSIDAVAEVCRASRDVVDVRRLTIEFLAHAFARVAERVQGAGDVRDVVRPHAREVGGLGSRGVVAANAGPCRPGTIDAVERETRGRVARTRAVRWARGVGEEGAAGVELLERLLAARDVLGGVVEPPRRLSEALGLVL